MKNESVGQKGQEIAEQFFKSWGYDVERSYELDNSLPFDLRVRDKHSKKWKKIQVKATNVPGSSRLIFRTRKSLDSRKISYEKGDLDLFVLVDVRTKSVVIVPYSGKGCHSFSREKWKNICKR